MSTGQSDLETLLAEQKAAPPQKVVASAPVNQPPQNDVDPGYLSHRNDLEGRAALSTLMAENAAPAAEPGKEAGKEQPSTGGEPASGAMSLIKGLASSGKAIGSVASDVGRGLLEAPKAAALTGPRDALESMLDGAKSLGDWTNKFMPSLQVTDKDGHLVMPRIVSAQERQDNPDLPGSLVDSWHLPKVDEPTTVTGGLVKSASQFITSMATLGRVFGPMGADAEGIAGHLATMGKSGAAVFAGFDKADGNVADLIQKAPALQNPITDFLSSKPDDTEVEGRLKNALSGVGFGELANGVLSGLKMLRGALTAKDAMGPSLAEAEAVPPAGVETPAAFKFLGDPDATPDEPLASIKTPDEMAPQPGELQAQKASAAQAATADLTPEGVSKMGEPAPEGEVAGPEVPGATEAQAKEPEVYINFARIDTPDDVKRTMSQLADAQKGNVEAAARGIQTFEATKLGAQFQDAWQVLMDRRIGQPLNDSEMLAGRQLLAQSAMKADTLTDMAIKDPTPENVFAWRKQMQTHAMIQAEVSGAQREVARSLSAMRIPVGAGDAIDRMSAIQGQLDQMGGLKTNMDFLQATKTLIDSGKLEDLGNVAEKTVYATTRDALITGWTNGLLTSPLTHVKVNLSNIGTIALRLGETRFAEAIDKASGYNGVPIGETAQTTAGLISALKDSFRYMGKLGSLADQDIPPGQSPLVDAAKAFKSGHYAVGESGDVDWSQQGQGASDALSIADSGWAGKAIDLASSVVTSPGRSLAGEHEFYRSIGMRMELNRFAYRQALNEVGSGKIQPEDVAGRVQDLVENPTQNISTQSVDGMTYQTFTDAPGAFAQHIEGLRNDFPLLRVIIPFYKIPSRIMSFTFERTPLAPLMSGWRADIAAGGARQSMALAKTGIGSSIMLAASDAVLNGKITGGGPKDSGKRQAMLDQGWLPYSVQTPSGRWVQYNRLETVGSTMALAADITETSRDYFTAVNGDNSDVEKVTAAGIAAIANNITSKTYFEGLAKFFETITDPRANAEGTLKSFAGSAVPAGIGWVDKLTDPYQRATYSMLDAIKSRIPGASETLQPQRSLWGDPVEHASGLGKAYDAFVPFASKEPNPQPIDQEIIRLGMNANLPPASATFGRGPSSAKINLQKDPEMYSRYVDLSGNAWKDPVYGNLGARDLLNQVVGGSHWLSPVYNMKNDDPSAGEAYSKAGMIKGIMDQYREGARGQLLKEYPELQHEITDKVQARQALRMPVLQ